MLETLAFRRVDLKYLGFSTTSNTNHNNSIKTLIMTDYTQAVEDTFRFLSQRLPSLENLACETSGIFVASFWQKSLLVKCPAEMKFL